MFSVAFIENLMLIKVQRNIFVIPFNLSLRTPSWMKNYSTITFTGDNSRSFIMCLKRKGIPNCLWFCNDPDRLRDLLIMKMCRVFNRYGQAFQFCRWKKYSPMGIPNTMGKTVLKYILTLLSMTAHSFTLVFYILSILHMAFILEEKISNVSSFTIVHEHLSITCSWGSHSLKC